MWVQKVSGGGIKGLAYAPNSRTLYAVDTGRTLTAWDLVTREGRRLFKFAASHPVHGLALVGERYLVAKLHDLIRVWDLEAGKPGTPPKGVSLVDTLTVRGSPGRVIYPTVSRLALCAWEPGGPTESEHLVGPFPGPVRAFDLSPDARTVAFIGWYSVEVVLIDVAGGGVTGRFSPPAPTGLVWGVRFAPDGRSVAVFCGGQIELWDVSRLTRLSGPVSIDNQYVLAAFAFHPTAPIFAALNTDRMLTLFSTETGAALRSLDFALGQAVQCVTFSPDGLTCAVGGSNKQFAVFDIDL